MWDELKDLFASQLEMLGQVSEGSRLLRESVLERQPDRMAELARGQEELLQNIEAQEERKLELLQVLRRRFGANAKMADIFEHADTITGKELQRLAELFARQLLKIKETVRSDRDLIKRAMWFVDFNINLMTQTTADDFYAPQAKGGGSVISKKKVFDQTI